jgi:hypothetical protein
MRDRIVMWMGVLVMAAGCAQEQPSPSGTVEGSPMVATKIAAETSEPTIAASRTAAPSKPLEVTLTAVQDVPLSANGPWWVFAASPADDQRERYLWVVNADGTGLTQLSGSYARQFSVRSQRDAEGEALIAMITSDSYEPKNLTLSILHLPSRQTEVITALTSSESGYSNQDPNDANTTYWDVLNIAGAITWSGSPQWSPDGQWVAFSGAMNGVTADVYSYELATGRIRQLTSGEDHAYQLVWSPDSRWILHTAAKDIVEHSGGLYEGVTGVWAASPDAGQVIHIQGKAATKFIGWVSPDTMIAYRGDGYANDYGLRTINIRTGDINYLEPSCFSGVAYSLEHNTYIVGINDFDMEFCGDGDKWGRGLYLFANDEGRKVLETDPSTVLMDLRWSPLLQMFTGMVDDRRIGVTLDGAIVEDLPSIVSSEDVMTSDDGLYWAWVDDGRLYIAQGPDFVPNVVETKLKMDRSAQLVWVP